MMFRLFANISSDFQIGVLGYITTTGTLTGWGYRFMFYLNPESVKCKLVLRFYLQWRLD